MIDPLVTVVIPCYQQARFLGTAIESVLSQTYPHFELLIVDDASPDETATVVAQFDDPRLTYLSHTSNQGLAAARNSGIRAGRGPIIALLDADDYFHPAKLAQHVAFLSERPAIGVTYNARFDLDHSRDTIRTIWRPPPTVSLADLVLGFPFAPSDMVLRRELAEHVHLFDESYVHYSEDLDINCRLALAGCLFAGVDRALNYRRYHGERFIAHLDRRLDAALRALEITFSDPRCPVSVRALRPAAECNTYLIWGYYALIQSETARGQQYIQAAIQRRPGIVDGYPSELAAFLAANSADEEGADHADRLRSIWLQLPLEAAPVQEQLNWAIGRGALLKGARNLLWNRVQDGRNHLQTAALQQAEVDETLLRKLADDLINYEREFGSQAAEAALHRWEQHLAPLNGRAYSWLKACYNINRAFLYYQAGDYAPVPGAVFQAISLYPHYLADRGVLAVLVRSVLGRLRPAPLNNPTHAAGIR